MKKETKNKLDNLAKILTNSFVEDASRGFTTKQSVDDLKLKTGKSDVEFFKAAIRKDAALIEYGIAALGVKNVNVRSLLKTTYQMNYLANEISHRIAMRSWKNGNLKKTLDRLFGRNENKLVQGEFDFGG